MEYRLLKSKDDYSYEHYPTSPLSKMTGFVGTAGEAVIDSKGKITLFVDPRYHIQADIQTKGKNVDVIKMTNQTGFIDYLTDFLGKDATLYFPSKSTYNFFTDKLSGVKLIPYETDEDNSSIDDDTSPVFMVPLSIAGKTLEDKIKEIKYNNFLITNLEHIAYLLNLRSYKTKNSAVFRAKLFIQDNKPILFTDYNIPDIGIKVLKMADFAPFITSFNSEIYVEKNISYYDYNLIKAPKTIDNNPVSYMASIKNKNELNHLSDSFKRLDCALFNFREKIDEGMSEFELNQIFEKELKKQGAYGTSFSTILAIDDNSSLIHYTAISKDKILKKGSSLLLDCGGYFEGGYATDITRVFAYKPEFCHPDLKEIYTIVLKAQLNAFNSEDNTSIGLVQLTRNILDKYNSKGFFFPHGLGHGIGIPVHQAPPTLSDKSTDTIKENNVFTIEPGLYKEGEFGIRLENTCFIKDNKKISLSHFPYEESLIDYSILNEEEKAYLNDWQRYY